MLANRLMHPRYGVPKTYVARVRGRSARRALGNLRQGVELEDGLTAPAEARLKKQSAKTALVELTIHEGRKRQVRRMFVAVGLPVEELHRRRYGPLTDKNLKLGGFRELSGDEVEALRRAGEEVGRRGRQGDRGFAGDARRRGGRRSLTSRQRPPRRSCRPCSRTPPWGRPMSRTRRRRPAKSEVYTYSPVGPAPE